MFLRRTLSTGRRVLCSLQKLQTLQGRGLKFPLHILEPKEAADAKATVKPRRRDLLATGFVFYNQETQQLRAFVNRCPHAMLELDFDDSDFFCEGFLHCKAHAAFFDPNTGICLQGPISSRKALMGLDELEVEIDGDDVVLLSEHPATKINSMASYDSKTLEDYKRKKKQELAKALAKRSDTLDVHEIQQRLHEKTMARLKQYKLMDHMARKCKK